MKLCDARLRVLFLATLLSIAVDASRVHADPEYPDELYMTAWGRSATSVADAIEQARGAVAAQIDASIRARTSSHAQATSRDGIVRESQQLSSTIETESHFERAEFIRIDASRSGSEAEGGYRAFAYLRRHDLAEAYRQDYRAHREGFTAATTTAEGSGAATLAESWSRACDHFGRMAVIASRYRAVTGRLPEQYPADRDAYLGLDARRRRDLGSQSIGVTITATDPRIGRTAIEVAVVDVLRQLGVGARVGPCAAATDLHLRLDVRVRERRILGGNVLHPWLEGSIERCADPGITDPILIESSRFDVRGRGDRTRLVSRLEAASLRQPIADALANVLPLQASVLVSLAKKDR